MSRIVTIVTLFLVIAIGLVLHGKNNQLIVVDYIVNSQELSLSLVIVAALFFGAISGLLAGLPLLIKLKHENVKLGKQVKINEKELNNLRVFPIKDSH